MNLGRILKTTFTNIRKNKWMSIATVVVISIVFTITSFFIAIAVMSRTMVRYYEKKFQVVVYFNIGTSEADIFALENKISSTISGAEITYVSENDAVKEYAQLFIGEEDLTENISSGMLPASLEIKAKDLTQLEQVKNMLDDQKQTNPTIQSIDYFKDIVDKMKTISEIINYGGTVLISALVVVTIALIIVTIAFNINAHKNEIEIMHLVGGTDSFIRWPFILEGAFYGATGALISTATLLIPFYIVMTVSKGSALYYWIAQQFTVLNLDFIIHPSIIYILIVVFVELILGTILGAGGSSIAVFKYLNLKEK